MDLFRSRATFEAEILVLQQQINVFRPASLLSTSLTDRFSLAFTGCSLRPVVRLRSLSRTLLYDGTAGASDRVGAENRDAAAADQRCRWKFAG